MVIDSRVYVADSFPAQLGMVPDWGSTQLLRKFFSDFGGLRPWLKGAARQEDKKAVQGAAQLLSILLNVQDFFLLIAVTIAAQENQDVLHQRRYRGHSSNNIGKCGPLQGILRLGKLLSVCNIRPL